MQFYLTLVVSWWKKGFAMGSMISPANKGSTRRPSIKRPMMRSMNPVMSLARELPKTSGKSYATKPA